MGAAAAAARGVQGRAKVRGLKKANACVRIQLACRVFLAKCKMYWKRLARWRQNAAVAIQRPWAQEQRTMKKVVQRKRRGAGRRVQCAPGAQTARRVVGASARSAIAGSRPPSSAHPARARGPARAQQLRDERERAAQKM